MSKISVNAKRQVRLPKDILKHLGVQPGEMLSVNKLPDGRVELSAARPDNKISDIFGLLKNPHGRSLSIEDMNKIAKRSWAGRR